MADTIIHGCVNADGTVHSGVGFTVSRSATGTYRVSYTSPFIGPPAVILTQCYKLWGDFGYGGGDTRSGSLLVASDSSKFKAVMGDENGVHINRNFCFLAIGPS